MLSINTATFPVGTDKKFIVSSFYLAAGNCCTLIGNMAAAQQPENGQLLGT
jgi:hypothetical protein